MNTQLPNDKLISQRAKQRATIYVDQRTSFEDGAGYMKDCADNIINALEEKADDLERELGNLEHKYNDLEIELKNATNRYEMAERHSQDKF